MKNNENNLRNVLLGLENISMREKEFITDRLDFIIDMFKAQAKLPSFKLSISIKQRKPKFGELRFSFDDLTKFDTLKKYTGIYGFVVPTMGSSTKKILKGEKKLKYGS